MLFEKNRRLPGMKTPNFVDNFMILYTVVNLVKLMETQDADYDQLTQQVLDATLKELFKTVLILDDGIWN
tara:strand:- start:2008 stop:2217 length:210 start_codon:yes stop_codon:yes gene_type:complete